MADKGKRGNPQNLRVPTSEEAREIGRKGGIASGISRKRRKTVKMAVSMVMNTGLIDDDIKEELARYGIGEEDFTILVGAILAQAKKSLEGDTNAFRLLLEAMGESSKERMHKEDMKLKKQSFEYLKERDAGVLSEIEDLEALEADIYEPERDSGEDSGEETDDSI